MNAQSGETMHPNLEHYYDSATDRAAVDVHIAGCLDCQAWLAEIHERLRQLACIEFVELVTAYLEDVVEEPLRARIEDHLRLCEGCRNYLDEVRSTLATIGRLGQTSELSEPARAGLIGAFRVWRRGLPEKRPGEGD